MQTDTPSNSQSEDGTSLLAARIHRLEERLATIDPYELPKNARRHIKEGHLHESHFAAACRVYNNANFLIADATLTDVTYNTERFDNDEMHDNTTNPSRITIRSAGIYLIGTTISWAANATGRRSVRILLNGATIIGLDQIEEADSATEPVVHSVITLYDLAAGDYLHTNVFQNSTAGLNVLSTANYSPEFWAVKVGERP